MTYLLQCKKCKKKYQYKISDTETLDLKDVKCPNCNHSLVQVFQVNSLSNANEEFVYRSTKNSLTSDRKDVESTRDYMRHYTLAQKDKEKELLNTL